MIRSYKARSGQHGGGVLRLIILTSAWEKEKFPSPTMSRRLRVLTWAFLPAALQITAEGERDFLQPLEGARWTFDGMRFLFMRSARSFSVLALALTRSLSRAASLSSLILSFSATACSLSRSFLSARRCFRSLRFCCFACASLLKPASLVWFASAISRSSLSRASLMAAASSVPTT